jgi:hypothetical protein
MAAAGKKSLFDVETEAITVIVARMQQLRRRAALPFLVLSAIVGNAGILAHAIGYWAVLGVFPDNTYVVNKFTIALACVIPVLPVAAVAVPIYGLLRARTRRAWHQQYRARGLSDKWLSRTMMRFP